MIITDPAVVIIQDRFGLPTAGTGRFRFAGRSRTSAKPFSSEAYADAGIRTASERGALKVQTTGGNGSHGRSNRS